MSQPLGFRLPRACLPRAGIDLHKWAVIACDQYTAEPSYWDAVTRDVGDAPSTLQLIFPEAYLESADAPERIARIQAAMSRYLAEGLLVERDGAIYVERSIGERVRRGLLLELDLEQYDFSAASTSLIRPTEGTMVERLAPRIAVRRGAALELPHILVLIDDPQDTVIGPIARQRGALEPLYDFDLMRGGGHVAGMAVDPPRGDAAARALAALADPQAFVARYGVPAGTPPLLFAVGDGNHSLATAKSIWDAMKAEAGMDHPCRWALVEVVNLYDPALRFAPIHRLLFGVGGDIRDALAAQFGARLNMTEVPGAEAMRRRVHAAQDGVVAAGIIGPGRRCTVIEIARAPSAIAAGTLQPFIDRFVEHGGARQIDYIHGDDVLERLAEADGCVGIHLPAIAKGELLRLVVRGGPLPRKAFSMGEADEKRFYIEARRLRA